MVFRLKIPFAIYNNIHHELTVLIICQLRYSIHLQTYIQTSQAVSSKNETSRICEKAAKGKACLIHF